MDELDVVADVQRVHLGNGIPPRRRSQRGGRDIWELKIASGYDLL